MFQTETRVVADVVYQDPEFQITVTQFFSVIILEGTLYDIYNKPIGALSTVRVYTTGNNIHENDVHDLKLHLIEGV